MRRDEHIGLAPRWLPCVKNSYRRFFRKTVLGM
jgi:hypothetical protein